MKRLLRKYQHYFSFHHYIATLRRQPAHIQHVSALVFAGSITLLIAILILYFDYGFWHETYTRNESSEPVTQGEPMVTVVSPGEMIGGFLKEASSKFKDITTSGSQFIEGKDSYTREDSVDGGQ